MPGLKTLVPKSLANKDCGKFIGKNFGELKSICIGNVLEIVRTGKKLVCKSQNLPKFFLLSMFFTVQYFS